MLLRDVVAFAELERCLSADARLPAAGGIVQADGRTGQFDDVLGRGWTLLRRGTSLEGALPPAQRDQLEVLEGKYRPHRRGRDRL